MRFKFKEEVEEEEASLYYHGRERKNAGSNSISRLKRKTDGVVSIVHKKEDIESDIIRFFDPIFAGNDLKEDGSDTGVSFKQDSKYLDSFLRNLSVLTEEDKASLNKPISWEEFKSVFKKLPQHKSPGSDGLPYEFYVKLFHIIGETLFEVYLCVFDCNELTESMYLGLVCYCRKLKESLFHLSFVQSHYYNVIISSLLVYYSRKLTLCSLQYSQPSSYVFPGET